MTNTPSYSSSFHKITNLIKTSGHSEGGSYRRTSTNHGTQSPYYRRQETSDRCDTPDVVDLVRYGVCICTATPAPARFMHHRGECERRVPSVDDVPARVIRFTDNGAPLASVCPSASPDTLAKLIRRDDDVRLAYTLSIGVTPYYKYTPFPYFFITSSEIYIPNILFRVEIKKNIILHLAFFALCA